MNEHKFTDEEVIKALECHADERNACSRCPISNEGCSLKMSRLAIDLINRQKAEVAYWMDAAANAKREAVKEFADRLKKYYGNLNSNTAAGLVEYHIEQIKEEMLCEK